MPVMVTACDRPAGNRFSVPLAFDRTGRYSLPMRIATRTDDAAEPNETYSSYCPGREVRESQGQQRYPMNVGETPISNIPRITITGHYTLTGLPSSSGGCRRT